MNYKDKLNEQVAYEEGLLKRFLPPKEGYAQVIMDAMEYSVMAGGKRVRPVLMLASFELFKGTAAYIDYFMAGIEMLHTYSLVHDDLPAMDNDELRRGRKTTHIVYGEDIGILAGDALLNYAYETCMKAFDCARDADDYRKISRALNVFMNKAGIYGMIGGQVVDVISDGTSLTSDELDFIFRNKTGALLEAPLMMGAILAGADDEEIAVMEKVGRAVGMAFQIQDDILDVIGDEKLIGKPVLSDAKNSKTTYVTLFGLDKAKKDAEAYSSEAIKLLKGLKSRKPGKDIEYLCELINMLVNRNK